MSTISLTQPKSVTFALIGMVEQVKAAVSHVDVLRAGVALVGPATVFMMWLTGALSTTATTAHDIVLMRQQMDSMQVQFSRMSDKIEAGPRADQLQDFSRRLSAHDGRMESDERALNEILARVVRLETQMNGVSRK